MELTMKDFQFSGEDQILIIEFLSLLIGEAEVLDIE